MHPYKFPRPAALDLHALAAHIQTAGLGHFGDRISTDAECVTFHLSDGAEPLTDEEAATLAAAVASYVYIKPYDYVALRVAEYPSAGDQLGAILKGGAELEAIQAKVQAVKDKYPKDRPANWGEEVV